MYFAVDQPSPSAVAQIKKELYAIQTAHTGESVNIFALIDGAFDEKFFITSFKTNFPRLSLYAGTPLSGLANAAPFLVHINVAISQYTEWVGKILSSAGSRPMWSIIVAAIDIHNLAKHFHPYIIAKSEDSLEWPVRWADTRVLPELLRAFDPDSIHDLLQPIYCWLCTSRTGSILRWTGKGFSEPKSPRFEKLPMDEATFAKLVEVSEVDSVISHIYDTQPELLKLRLPSECYQIVAKQLEVADKFDIDIDQRAVRVHFASLALYLQQDFFELPEIHRMLESVKNGSDYMHELQALKIELWESTTA